MKATAALLSACCALVLLTACDQDPPVPQSTADAGAVRGLRQLPPLQAMDRCDRLPGLEQRIECFDRVGHSADSLVVAQAPRG
ncbi:MAG TPA: hypothetical protein VLI06_07035 [Solimonas sp.]|nr:hypothetical protein [Solimonas sp.]